MKTIITVIICIGLLAVCGCAAGSATAGYSLRAGTADELSPKAERELTERIMQKVKQWHDSNQANK